MGRERTRPQALLYAVPKAGASATYTHRTMSSRTYCISCSNSDRPGLVHEQPAQNHDAGGAMRTQR